MPISSQHVADVCPCSGRTAVGAPKLALRLAGMIRLQTPIVQELVTARKSTFVKHVTRLWVSSLCIIATNEEKCSVEHRLWQVNDKRLVLDRSPWLKVWDEQVQLPDGTVIDGWVRLEMPRYVLIFAVTEEGVVPFFRHYKHGMGGAGGPARRVRQPRRGPAARRAARGCARKRAWRPRSGRRSARSSWTATARRAGAPVPGAGRAPGRGTGHRRPGGL